MILENFSVTCPSNRTSLELKQLLLERENGVVFASNRTSLELKHATRLI